MYRGLKAKDRLWLKKFNRVFSGRASKEECDELGVPEATRLELYNARYASRQDTFLRATHSVREERVSADPTEAITEIIRIRQEHALEKLPFIRVKAKKA